MIQIIVFSLMGTLILVFSRTISRRLYIKVNNWADETEIEKLRNRIKVNSPTAILIAVLLFGLFWLLIAGLLLLGKQSVDFYAFIIIGIVSLLFNRKLGAINSCWALRYRDMPCPILIGRLNVIVGGIVLVILGLLGI